MSDFVFSNERITRDIPLKSSSHSISIRKGISLSTYAVAVATMMGGMTFSLERPIEDESIECRRVDDAVRKLNDGVAIKSSMQRRLEELRSLKEGWDGFHALPVEEASYKNVNAIISQLSSFVLNEWNLFPNTNGTLLFTLKGKRIASISIGNKSFSYMAMKGAHVVKGQEKFDVNRLGQVIEDIRKIFTSGK